MIFCVEYKEKYKIHSTFGNFVIKSIICFLFFKNSLFNLLFSHTKEMKRVMISSPLNFLNYSKGTLLSFEPIAWQVFRNSALFVISLDCNWLTDFWTADLLV